MEWNLITTFDWIFCKKREKTLRRFQPKLNKFVAKKYFGYLWHHKNRISLEWTLITYLTLILHSEIFKNMYKKKIRFMFNFQWKCYEQN